MAGPRHSPRAGTGQTPTQGTPQGAVISPLLANLYLHPLDVRMMALGYRMGSSADDFVVLCRSSQEADVALAEVRAWGQRRTDYVCMPIRPAWETAGKPGRVSTFAGLDSKPGTAAGTQEKPETRQGQNPRENAAHTGDPSSPNGRGTCHPLLRGWFGYFKHACPDLPSDGWKGC
ncbi:MAG: reverse transcriptase domain-containing protein [Methylococcales bacterium]